MIIPDDLYAHLKEELKELAGCYPESGAVAFSCEDLLDKLIAAEKGEDWKAVGYAV